MKVTLTPLMLLQTLIVNEKKSFITVSEVAKKLGVSKKTAGKILASLEKQGYLKRWSKTAYKVIALPITS